jgi:hypothetical protein
MATTTFCDWCGGLIEGAHPTLPLRVEAAGRGETGDYFHTQFGHYHGERGDEDSCIYQVAKLLQDRG